jgi:hypothetical protein
MPVHLPEAAVKTALDETATFGRVAGITLAGPDYGSILIL